METAGSPLRETERTAAWGDPPRHTEDLLLPFALHYYQTGDLSAFLEATSGWIVSYAARRLSRDPDTVGDFYVVAYEQIPGYLEDYRKRREVPFTAFFTVCLRNEFMNFIRARRRRELTQDTWTDQLLPQVGARSPLPILSAEAADLHISGVLFRHLDELPLPLRLPVKLTHGLDPDREELRELVRLLGGPSPASRLMSEFHRRREARRRKLRRLEDRVAHLSYLIDGMDCHGLGGGVQRWSRWKARIHRVLAAHHPLFSLSELGAMYRRNKSTMLRRLQRAVELLRDAHSWQDEAVNQ